MPNRFRAVRAGFAADFLGRNAHDQLRINDDHRGVLRNAELLNRPFDLLRELRLATCPAGSRRQAFGLWAAREA
eukprot:9496481-Pyramimonas_sp.AAC.1